MNIKVLFNCILFLISIITGLIGYFITNSYIFLIGICIAIIFMTIIIAIYVKKVLDLEAEIESMRKSTLYELTKNAAVYKCNKWSDKDKNHIYDEMWKFVHNYGRKPSDLFEIIAEVLRDRETDCE